MSPPARLRRTGPLRNVRLRRLARWACDGDLVLDRGSSIIVLVGRDLRDLPTVGDDLAYERAHVQGDYFGGAVRVVDERLVSAGNHGHEVLLTRMEPYGRERPSSDLETPAHMPYARERPRRKAVRSSSTVSAASV